MKEVLNLANFNFVYVWDPTLNLRGAYATVEVTLTYGSGSFIECGIDRHISRSRNRNTYFITRLVIIA
jgi:hypothetical protein